VNVNVFTCAYDNGCAATWNASDCCVRARCPEGASRACPEERCGAEMRAFQGCVEGVLRADPPCVRRAGDSLTR
jgi:hypothetical protein